jgi:protease I
LLVVNLEGIRVALFVADQYADRQFWYPYYRLIEAGADVEVVGPNGAEYSGRYGIPVRAQRSIDAARPASYDAVVIPGGEAADQMLQREEMVSFVRALVQRGALVAAIGEGARLLLEAGVVDGLRVTGGQDLRDELVTAGARWVEQEVVRDGNVITSRRPDDLPAFCRAITDTLSLS